MQAKLAADIADRTDSHVPRASWADGRAAEQDRDRACEGSGTMTLARSGPVQIALANGGMH